MPFTFLKYLQPTHYFRLKKYNGFSIFPKVETLPIELVRILKKDRGYKSEHAQKYDLSWRVVQRGYIPDGDQAYKDFEKLPVVDNYRFIRKNFHAAWVLYVLILRLFSFKNPILEIKAWLNTRHVIRDKFERGDFYDKDYQDFNSNLINESPIVSVVIPTLNRYSYLKDVLKDFEQQDYKNFEVIVVDQSEPFNQNFYEKFGLNLNVIRQNTKALWLARNTAIKSAKGELIALSEDDVRIQSDWISAHIKCLDFFDAEVSAGVFYPNGKQMPVERSYFSIASQFATGNAMLYKNVFKKVGLFDRQFERQRMGDGEYGMRIYLEGIKSVSNPYASCIDVKAGTGGLREMGSWDAFRPANVFAPRPIPSVLYFFRRYFGRKASIYALMRTIPISVFPYQFKKNKFLLLIGAFITLLLFPIVLIQVLGSWRKATKKINHGPLIETLD